MADGATTARDANASRACGMNGGQHNEPPGETSMAPTTRQPQPPEDTPTARPGP
ncbi:hypothetical protein BJV78DRAFT_1260293 [Lactifluus subvellereus]|nr:hypothetical protein BJV78DRAFT_1260293 [Lactifluus subvellereus]